MKIFTQNCCNTLLKYSNRPELRKKYLDNEFDSSDFEYLKMETKYNLLSKVNLDPSKSKDLENSMTIFDSLKDLDRVQANDKRLWVTLTHTIFFRYSKERWASDKDSEEKIIRRFHYEGASLETRMRNSISRLWWAAKLTYNEQRSDPYELTKLLWSKQDIYQNLVERSYGTYESVLIGFLEFYSENQGLGESQLRRLFTGLNAIGGVKALGVHSKEEIKRILQDLVIYYRFNTAA